MAPGAVPQKPSPARREPRELHRVQVVGLIVRVSRAGVKRPMRRSTGARSAAEGRGQGLLVDQQVQSVQDRSADQVGGDERGRCLPSGPITAMPRAASRSIASSLRPLPMAAVRAAPSRRTTSAFSEPCETLATARGSEAASCCAVPTVSAVTRWTVMSRPRTSRRARTPGCRVPGPRGARGRPDVASQDLEARADARPQGSRAGALTSPVQPPRHDGHRVGDLGRSGGDGGDTDGSRVEPRGHRLRPVVGAELAVGVRQM
jgi:hypothetical protein